ncbi:MAG: hypothetical protein QXE81_04615 [Desulfurococcaceae archaeon]
MYIVVVGTSGLELGVLSTTRRVKKSSSRQSTLYKWVSKEDKIPRERILKYIEKMLTESSSE